MAMYAQQVPKHCCSPSYTRVASIVDMLAKQLRLRSAGAARAVKPVSCTCRRRRLQVNALLKQKEGVDVKWTQTTDDVRINVPVPSESRGRDIKFDVHPKRLSLKLHGEPLLEGSLADAGQIAVDDCYWTLEVEEDSNGVSHKYVAITLGKATMGYQSWDMLLESERVDLTITDRVFLEVSIGGKPAGKIAIGLFGKTVPKTVENFKELCTGSRGVGQLGKPLHFKGSSFHRIIPGFMAQGGDITANNGTGGESIYGPNFNDENFKIKHDEAGLVAMANAGPNTNSSQFYILFAPAPHLDGKHCVFGRVLAGMDLVLQLEANGTPGGQPSEAVQITDSGVLPDDAAVDAIIDENKQIQMASAA